MDNYYLKYFKYKNKYLKLLDQVSGSNTKKIKNPKNPKLLQKVISLVPSTLVPVSECQLSILPGNITANNEIIGINNSTFRHQCFESGYRQHIGECWNDAIQTIITFSAPFIKFQKLSLLRNNTSIQIIEQAYNRRSEFIPIYLTNIDHESFKSLLITYLNNLLSRFNNLYKSELIEKKTTNSMTPFDESKKEQNASITCTLNALKFTQINSRQNDEIFDRQDHGGSTCNEVLILHVLSFILLEDDNFINFDIYEEPCLYDFQKSIKDIVNSTKNYFALQLGTDTHAFCVYTCSNNINYYYDDENKGSTIFDWKNWFKKDILVLNIDNEEYKLKDHPDSNNWQPYRTYSHINSNNKSILAYYNSTINKIIIWVPDDSRFKEFDHCISSEYTHSTPPNVFVSRRLSKITNIIGLYIDTATSRDEYIRKLNLENLLYINAYDLPFVKNYVNSYVNSLIIDGFKYIDTFYTYIDNAFILSDIKMIKKMYSNTGLDMLNSYNKTKPWYFDARIHLFFKTLNQYKDFVNRIIIKNDEITDYNFVKETIVYNETIGFEVLKYIITDPKYNLQPHFLNISINMLDNGNINMIIWLINNNVDNCMNNTYIDEDNNVTFMHYLYNNYNKDYDMEFYNLIIQLCKIWDDKYLFLFTNNDSNGKNLLHYLNNEDIPDLKDALNFIKSKTSLRPQPSSQQPRPRQQSQPRPSSQSQSQQLRPQPSSQQPRPRQQSQSQPRPSSQSQQLRPQSQSHSQPQSQPLNKKYK
jgi:hypothetical protein